jgi:diacylglycerol kinase (ATP)
MKIDKKLEILPSKQVVYNPIKSLMYAFNGLYLAFFRELNIRIQFALGLFLTGLGVFNGHYISSMANFILMGIVVSLEMVNTAFETLCDLAHPEKSESVKIIKDLSAGAVLMVALVWLVVILYLLALIFGINLVND